MNKLTEMYLNSEYDEMFRYSETLAIVRDKASGRILVKKQIEKNNINIYKALSQMQIRGIPQIFSVADSPDAPVVFYEYIEGVTVKEYISRYGKMDAQSASKYVSDICAALSWLHRLGIVHRDITPSNVIIGNSGQCYIIDFGISRYIKENSSVDTQILGTAGFAPPEQFGFRQTDAKSDIYSTGVLFNFMLTGAMPDKIMAPDPFTGIINRCLALDPVNRYASAMELHTAISSAWGMPGQKREKSHEKLKLIFLALSLLICAFMLPSVFAGNEPIKDRLDCLLGLVFVFLIPFAAIGDFFGIIEMLSLKYEWRRSERIGIRVFVTISSVLLFTIINNFILSV